MSDPQQIRHYVLPLIEAQLVNGTYIFKKFHGTSFLIGTGEWALTNKHLLGVAKGNQLCLLDVDDTEWKVWKVINSEEHPSEDLAILQIEDLNRPSFLNISSSSEHSSFKYMQWSYPEEVVNELVEDGVVRNRPDLVFLEGYIRRRLSNFHIPSVQGSSFYELSEPGVIGCSGSPVIDRKGGKKWKVIGMFVAQRSGNNSAVGYALRFDTISDWTPEIAGHSISDL